MGISKTLWMDQNELEHINSLLEMSGEEFFEVHGYTKPTAHLRTEKEKLEDEIKDLTMLGKKAGLMKA